MKGPLWTIHKPSFSSLQGFTGHLQADAFSGHGSIDARSNGQNVEVDCGARAAQVSPRSFLGLDNVQPAGSVTSGGVVTRSSWVECK